ncbi:MAG: hypothetical protein M5U01_01235 [Ardenticatenaceae bacterium]|nr:hypothetical protein [Ardenticatenaceae bacterium]HBY96600.1 hypothetical protein [Chloroflexota bacterium]
MRSLFKNVANELIKTLTVEDLKEIMDDTVDTVLSHMTPEERMAFSREIVGNAVGRMLTSLNDEQRTALLRDLLPIILHEFRADQLSPEELVAALRQSSPPPPA